MCVRRAATTRQRRAVPAPLGIVRRSAYAGKVEGCSLKRFEDATGLTLTDRDGTLREELPPISQFLNRLLALTQGSASTLAPGMNVATPPSGN